MDLGLLIEAAAKVGFVAAVWLGLVAPLVWLERKVCAWIQERTGPNRVGPWGLIQPVADVIKFFFKEDVIPAQANKVLFILAPCILVFTALVATATLPFGDQITIAGRDIKLVVADLDVGILWIFAVGSLSVYGILLAGWSSANKFAFLGGLRSSAQIISYELGLTLSVVGALLFAGSLRLRDVVASQGDWAWNCWTQPLGCLIFLVAMFAETNRNPFDLPEAESELVAGYHTEYTGMRFAMFFMAEYVAMITMSGLMVTLFFGGWNLPGLSHLKDLGPAFWIVGQGWLYGLLTVAIFLGKMLAFLFFFIWVRWTLPRFRYDQLMALGWKAILPLALLQVFAAGVKVAFGWLPYAVLMAVLLAVFVLFLRQPRTVARRQMPRVPPAPPAVVGGA